MRCAAFYKSFPIEGNYVKYPKSGFFWSEGKNNLEMEKILNRVINTSKKNWKKVVRKYSSEIMEVYIAKGLKVDPLPKDVDEDIVVHVVPFEKLVAQICSGEFTDIKTVAAVLLVARNNALLGSS